MSSSTVPIQFAVIGAGNVAVTHAMAIRDAPGAVLTAIHSRGVERGQALAQRFGAAFEPDLDELLARDDVDAVTIATPSGAHLEPVQAAATAGCHVLCEKPLEVTLARTDELIAACASAGVKLGCFFQSRQNRNVERIRGALKQGRFGRLLLASVEVKWYRSQEYYDTGGWRGTWRMDGGGALMNQGIHMVDLLCFLAGVPVSAHALQGPRSHERIEVEDTAAALVRFANGAVGTIQASTSCAPGFPRRLELSGEAGSVAMEDDRLVRWSFTQSCAEDERIRAEGLAGDNLASGSADPTAHSPEGHRRLVEDMVCAIREDAAPAVTGESARVAIALINAIYESVRNGGPVELDLESDIVA